ncbi:hypothetical protein GCM10025771_31460 [Niveibacterium umoris]|uniref:Uncharacterized protein n=1 Tax=Niveibacterium umoris TaxID=1193620 RepID=A0A840BJ79_9RHOO|nr:hypothetical protein [Niveibacterium umoris]MBB4011658.1 hypothetical protein [Niveibacterium umoris]
MSDEHQRGAKKGEFCGIPGNPCECGNDYIKICEPGWSSHTFARLVKAKAGKFAFEKKYEAHHVMCVAPVSAEVIAKPAIEGVVKATKWCINNSDNMLAMPLWGHTVMWYCDITEDGGEIKDDSPAPPFANIPQHDWDHNCKQGYTWEIEQEAKKLADKLKEMGHKAQPKNLAGALNALSSRFKTTLATRGGRKGGTHKMFIDGASDSEWCHPFSMASDGKVTSKGFPVRSFDERVAKWIKRIAEAIKEG